MRSAAFPVMGAFPSWTTTVCACVAMNPSMWQPRSLHVQGAQRWDRGVSEGEGGFSGATREVTGHPQQLQAHSIHSVLPTYTRRAGHGQVAGGQSAVGSHP